MREVERISKRERQAKYIGKKMRRASDKEIKKRREREINAR